MTQNSITKEDQEIEEIMSEIQGLRASIAQSQTVPEVNSGEEASESMTQEAEIQAETIVAAETPVAEAVAPNEVPEEVQEEVPEEKKEEPKGLLDMAIEADQQSETEEFSEDELEEIDEDELEALMEPDAEAQTAPARVAAVAAPRVNSRNNADFDTDGNPSVEMTLTGNMTLRLKYAFNGQQVSVGFKDQFLEVELSDGTQFRIPVRAAQNTAMAQKPKLKAVG